MVSLRKVTYSDIDLLYSWANDPAVRRNSFNVHQISYKDHQQWFKRVMEDENTIQFILMDDNLPVGQIRLNLSGDEAEIGYSIAKEYRGRGYGHQILQQVVKEVRKNHPIIKTLVAKVKTDNMASNRLFQSEGYFKEYICYTKDIITKPLY